MTSTVDAVTDVPRFKHDSKRMEKLNRLGWAAGLSFRSYELRLGIRVNQPEVLEALTEYLPPGWKPATSPMVDGLYSWWRGARPAWVSGGGVGWQFCPAVGCPGDACSAAWVLPARDSSPVSH